ncbi:MAG: hypothetical protein HOI95_24720, partial [Chromatiales bacterium]|nr:hypothetical protein [Chromatiales bacterium]
MTASTNRLAAGRHQLPGLPNRQRGIALMILLLVVTLGSAAVVLGELNSRVHTTADIGNTIATARVLKEAKEALLGAAVSDVAPLGLPQRPGQLPWPDRSTDGNYDGRSDCVTNNFVIDHLIGRFPYFGEGQCFFGGRSSVLSLDTMYRDGSGQPLWYAVSRNLVNAGSPQLSVNPDLVDNPAYEWMRVCDSRGRLVSDRVAAVIIAPGPPLGTQDRSLQTPRDRLRQQYLERVQVTDAGGRTSWLSNYDYNANADDGEMDGPGECRERDNLGNSPTGEEFVIPVGRDPALQNTFNDQLVYITADELIEGVQQRAINVVVQALEAYRDEVVTSGGAARGRFPWMSPFANAWEGKQVYDADPDTLLFEGQVSGGSATTLVDSTRTFDVSLIGAALRNLTTGASTVVTGIAATGEIEFGQLL